jgi:hypothetical protein
LSIDRHLQNSPQSDLTTEGTPNPSVITSVSASSSSFPHTSQPQTTPHQTITSSSPSTTQTSTVIPTPAVVSPLPTAMANRYAPLVLPANLGAMPQDYQSKITPFDGTGTYTAQQHTKKMTDYFEIYEIDTDDVQMRIFVQSLSGEVRTWFRALAANSIDSLETLYRQFLNRWEKKKDPLQILI